MSAAIPPSRLPAGYRQAWSAVAEAAERTSASRAELARRLSVSTHTLQRILVDGDVPDFRRPQTRRLALSWTRTLTRLASRLGREPRDWIEAAGIPWDDAVRTASDRELRRLAPAARPGGAGAVLEVVRARAAAGTAEPVVVGVVAPEAPDEEAGADALFLRRYAERLVAAVDPTWGVGWRRCAPGEAVDELLREPPSIQLAVGLFDTPHLRGRGLDLIPVPGWRAGFRALLVRRAGGDAAVPVWDALADVAAGREAVRFLVQEADPAAQLVRAHWGVPPDAVLVRRRPSAASLAQEVFHEARRHGGGPVALVADERTTRAAWDALAAADGFRPEWEAAPVLPPPGEEPRYELAVAVRADARDWRSVLAHARDELFGAAAAGTAALYADAIADAARRAETRGEPLRTPHGPMPGLFPEASPRFLRYLGRRLLERLAEAEPAGEERWERAMALARARTPREWAGALADALHVVRRAEAAPHARPYRPGYDFCRSCSTPLFANRGPSDRYCRDCADAAGNLRPREEVRGMLAAWIARWQGDLPEDEALRRADRLMSAMPAWAGTEPNAVS